jgi:hypothetical protein
VHYYYLLQTASVMDPSMHTGASVTCGGKTVFVQSGESVRIAEQKKTTKTASARAQKQAYATLAEADTSTGWFDLKASKVAAQAQAQVNKVAAQAQAQAEAQAQAQAQARANAQTTIVYLHDPTISANAAIVDRQCAAVMRLVEQMDAAKARKARDQDQPAAAPSSSEKKKSNKWMSTSTKNNRASVTSSNGTSKLNAKERRALKRNARFA